MEYRVIDRQSPPPPLPPSSPRLARPPPDLQTAEEEMKYRCHTGISRHGETKVYKLHQWFPIFQATSF